MRVFPPLHADHPAVGRPCDKCGVPFREGDRTTIVPSIETPTEFSLTIEGAPQGHALLEEGSAAAAAGGGVMNRMLSAADIFNVQRDVVKVELVDGVWQLDLSCGHKQSWEIEPPARPSCRACLDALIERMNSL